jgi:hypothetical protein
MTQVFKLFFCLLVTVCCSERFSIAFAASTSTIATSDAFVATGPTGDLSDNNYGGGGALAIAAAGLPNGEFQTLMKFGLSGVRNSFDTQFGAGGWSVQSVSLRLSSSPHSNPAYNDIAPGLFGVSLMQNNSWVEGTGNASNPAANGISYSSLQSTFINNAVDRALGTFSFPGGTSGLNSYALDLSPDLTADILGGSDMSLRLFAADNSVSYLFSSRAQSSGQPELLITVVPEPGAITLLALASALLLWRGRRLLGESKR